MLLPVVEGAKVWPPMGKVAMVKAVTGKAVTGKVAMAKAVTGKVVMGPLRAVPGSMGWGEEPVRQLRTLPEWSPSCAV